MRQRAPLTSALVALVCLVGFTALAAGVQAGGTLVRFDRDQAERFNDWASGAPTVRAFFRWVTDLGAGTPLTAFAVLVVAWVALAGRYRLALLCAAVMLVNNRSIDLLKELFARPRPRFVDGWPPLSFPSGHTQGSMVIYGLTIYLVFLRWPASPFRWVAAGVLGTLILLVGLSRLMLGVHYFSDVLGGMLIGMAWLGLTMAAVDWVRFRSAVPTPGPSPTPRAAAPPP